MRSCYIFIWYAFHCFLFAVATKHGVQLIDEPGSGGISRGTMAFKPLSASFYAPVYEYPVGIEGELIYWALQTAEGPLMLATHNITTNQYTFERFTFNQEQLHSYSIERFMLLPDHLGYSFIDNDRLRVKYAGKGSPTSIDFIEPIYQLQQVIWLSAKKGILSAKWHNHFGIFYFTCDGRTEPIIWDGASDYLFPQVMDDTLFCIMHKQHEKEYTVCSLHLDTADIFSIDWNVLSFEEKTDIILGRNSTLTPCATESCISAVVKHEAPIGFLIMVSQTEGYYCAYQPTETHISSDYYQLQKDTISWQSTFLFSFTVAKERINELREQILPFMPRICKEYIYFSDAGTECETAGLFRYHKKSGVVTPLMLTQGNVILPGIYHEHVLYYGIRRSL